MIRKTSILIETTCLADLSTVDIAKLTPAQRSSWDLLTKLSPSDLLKVSPEQQEILPSIVAKGSGFLVAVPSDQQGIFYEFVVTNRHVMEPGVEYGKPCKVLRRVVIANRKSGSEAIASVVPVPVETKLYYPSDDSTDLATFQMVLSVKEWDIRVVPFKMLATDDLLSNHLVVEGSPVLFTGFFTQYSGVKVLQPIVRTGTIAMLPTDPVKTTLGAMGNVYLTETHVYHGNSGSPMFVDVGRFGSNSLHPYDYRLLGVVSGYFPEDIDVSTEGTTLARSKGEGNSGVAFVVPADLLKGLIESAASQEGLSISPQ